MVSCLGGENNIMSSLMDRFRNLENKRDIKPKEQVEEKPKEVEKEPEKTTQDKKTESKKIKFDKEKVREKVKEVGDSLDTEAVFSISNSLSKFIYDFLLLPYDLLDSYVLLKILGEKKTDRKSVV